MAFAVKVISGEDHLAQLVAQINSADWDEGTEFEAYDVASLRAYLEKQDTIFLACYQLNTNTMAGMASARIQQKPYDHSKWLYIDEVDTCVDFRQQGVGTALMQKLLQIADDNDCDEVWLGAEKSNHVANRFYESLQPTAIEAVIGYTFEL